MANLSSEDPIYDEAGTSYDSNTQFEVQNVARVFTDLSAEEKRRFSKLINGHEKLQSMTCPEMPINSKFVNNMLLEWSRFITEVKLNRGLKESNFDQLYAYLKQHEVHANENRMMMERFIQPTDDPLALVSNANQIDDALQRNKATVVKMTRDVVQDVRDVTTVNNQGRAFQRTMQEEILKGIGHIAHVRMVDNKRTQDQTTSKTRCCSMICLMRLCLYWNEVQLLFLDRRTEDTRELAEITRKRMLLKMQSPLCVENKIRISPPDYSKENLLATFAPQRNLTPEQIFWSIDDNNRKKAETLALKPISALTVYPPNTPVKLVPRILPTKSQVKINLYVLTQLFTEFDKTCKTRITPSGLTEGERGFEQTKRCYLTEVIPFFKTLKEHFVGVQTALFKEVKVMEEIFDQMNDEVDQNTVDKQCAEIERKNLLIANENLIANCLSNQLLYDVEKSRCLDLEAEMSKVHNESKDISKLERENINLQLKYQHLQESFDNNKSQTSQEAPDFNSFFKIKNLEHQIQEKDNVIRDLKVLVSNVNDRRCEPYNANDVTALIEQNECVRVELEEVKQHYKELFESIHITRASTNEKTSSLLTQIEDLKAQLEGNLKVAARSSVKTKVLAPGMYAIDVEPIPPRLKNNRNAHLTYINHLKESVETVREIVEEARVVKPLDNVLNYACQYTKLSQELVEYVIGTCPKEFTERDSKAPSIPLTRKKQVTFTDTCSTSTNNTQKHGVHQKTQPSNVQVIPSTGVSSSTRASGSKPRSNTKHNRILPAKSVNNKKVEDHPRTNKSIWTKVNRVDYSISSKRVVINSNSESVEADLETKRSTGKKVTLGKLKCGYQWRPTGKKFDLGELCPLTKATGKLFADIGYQWRPTGKKLALGKLDCGYQWRPTGKKFALGKMCHLTKLSVKCSTLYANQQDPNKN
ncbi:hypothetical protein Tco_0976647 [Tanacetum coccineum]|uniref:Integrase, catalytic region, zinc finger, CCHC-type, peptidase aspartic, catalytic n=1 Tax=Tanacetum coccineum TaxID=301880 RepID=A0ABQ5EHU4_9ASTR